MGNGELSTNLRSTDLGLGILAPASPVRPVEEESPHPELDGKRRRRARASGELEEEKSEEEKSAADNALDAAEPSAHQLDHLA